MSRLRAYAAEAFSAIWRNRTRSILTMLGMIIGTASIIGVLGISRAASGGIASTLSSFGDQGITITVDPNQDDPQSAAIQYRDARTIADAAPSAVEHVEPNYQRQFTVHSGRTTLNTFVVSGSDVHKDTLTLREGRRIDSSDVEAAARNCLLAGPLADHLFPGRPALGEVIKVGGMRCNVIGVYDQLKGGFFNSIGGNEFVEVPYTTFHQLAPGPTDGLNIYGAPGVPVGRVSDDVDAVLQRLHGSHAQYVTQDNTALINGFGSVINIIAAALTGVGAIALVVAGIGIMNIMLVSVTERTREIGLRKAIGASRRDVALQFLLEAILLSLMGGGIGTLLGFVTTVAAYASVAALVGPAPIPYLLIISVAVGFSMLVGCVFGTYPALRAARLDPIAALRS